MIPVPFFFINLTGDEEKFQKQGEDRPEGDEAQRQVPEIAAPTPALQKTYKNIGRAEPENRAKQNPRYQHSTNRDLRRYDHDG